MTKQEENIVRCPNCRAGALFYCDPAALENGCLDEPAYVCDACGERFDESDFAALAEGVLWQPRTVEVQPLSDEPVRF